MKPHFVDHLHQNEYKKDIILGFINIHTLPESCKRDKKLILKNVMPEKRFGQTGL